MPGRIEETKNKGLTWKGYYDEYDKGKVGAFSSEELWFPQGNDPIFEVGLSDNSEEEDSDDNGDDVDDDDRFPVQQVRTAKDLYDDSDSDSDDDNNEEEEPQDSATQKRKT